MVDEALLDDKKDNLLVSVFSTKSNSNKYIFGIASLNIVNGDFQISQVTFDDLTNEIDKINPVEILVDENAFYPKFTHEELKKRQPSWHFEYDRAISLLKEQFNTKDLSGFDYSHLPVALSAAGSILQYIKDTQRVVLNHIKKLKVEYKKDKLILDSVSQRNLELIRNFHGGQESTLLSVYDRTATSMGSRLLKRWITNPILDHKKLLQRHLVIEDIVDQQIYSKLYELLRHVGDVERIATRISLQQARPRDLVQLRNTLLILPKIQELIKNCNSNKIKELKNNINVSEDVLGLLEKAIVDNPPVVIRDGGVIAFGFDRKLDELRSFSDNAGKFLLDLETQERQRTRIPTLKVSYNRVSGYYIEISKSQSQKAPLEYIRRQTLKNTERFITPELKEFEEKSLSSKSKALSYEKYLYEKLLERILDYIDQIRKCALALANLDVLNNLAERAVSLRLVKPELTGNCEINIEKGRHPVIETINEQFIPNDIYLNNDRKILIITGPNMGGKSTYMRQVALIVILTCIGSYVPAKKAVIGRIDRIFTRIGAQDDLATGRSTFMVEMTETANILHNATENSLVLMDEIGRGTSTFDGLSLAWASCEYLANSIKALTLFATHYFELTSLTKTIPIIKNIHFDAIEYEHEIIFMHAVKEGSANKSYGLKVAQAAGVPREIIESAEAKLFELENQNPDKNIIYVKQNDLFKSEVNQKHKEIMEKLIAINPEELTPLKALQKIFELKDIFK